MSYQLRLTIPNKYIPRVNEALTMTESEYIDTIETNISNAKAEGKLKTSTFRQYQYKWDKEEPNWREFYHFQKSRHTTNYNSDLI